MKIITLNKGLGFFSATMLVISSIIGSGIFKKVAPMTMKLGSPSLVLICWVIAGLVTLMGALSYAEIASRLAQTGGLYAYLKAIYGKWTGYLFGWACFSVIQTASIASIAFVFAEAVQKIFPFQTIGDPVKFTAIITILGLTVVNYLGLVLGALVTNIFTVLKMLGIAVVVYFGFTYAVPGASSQILQSPGDLPSGGSLIPTMFSAMLGAFWAFDGLNNIGFIGGEIKNAKRILPIALILGVAAVLAIYLTINISYFYALPKEDILTIANTKGSVFAIEMVQKLSGATWALFVSMLIMVSTFGTTNSSIQTSSRIYYAMATDGVFFKFFRNIHPRFLTPAVALISQSIWASLLVVWGTFDTLTDMLIFASFIFYGLGAYGVFILRKRNANNEETALRIPSFIPIGYIAFCIALVAVTLYQDTVQSLVGVGLILLGIPLYWVIQKVNAATGNTL